MVIPHIALEMTETSVAAESRGFDRVFAYLRELILARAIKPGDRLASERELSLQAGVSRPVLREALRALAMIGVVEIRHGIGTIVRRPDVSVLGDFFAFALAQHSEMSDDVMEARVAIECQAIRLACRRATVSDIERLRVALDRVETTMDDAAERAAADHAFHAALVRASKSETLNCLYDAMADLLIRTHRDRRDLGQRFADIKDYVAQDHARLFNAIVARDEERADVTLRKHFAIGDEYRRKAAVAGHEEPSANRSPA